MLKIVAVTFLAIGTPSMLKIKGTCSEFKVLGFNGENVRAEVSLDSCDTGISLRNKHMREKYLQTGTFPKAIYEGPFHRGGGVGSLSVHGQASPVTVTRNGNVIEFSTKVSAHGIGVPSFLGVTVADEVKVSVEVE